MMRNKICGGTIFTTIGLLLIAAALFLTCNNLYKEYRAGESVDHILSLIHLETDNSGNTDKSVEKPDYIINPDMEMPITEIEGNEYIGILNIPSLGLSLPVMSEWSYPNLEITPCRYSGSAYNGNLTIAGHNYRTHFGPLNRLLNGDEIIFSDIRGRSFTYIVKAMETLEPTAIEDMVSDDWDLTLFTCTMSGQARFTVRCLRED